MSRSFLDCPHERTQQYTECCLDCGYNVYISNEEYLADLRRKVNAKDPTTMKIRELEKKLGIK